MANWGFTTRDGKNSSYFVAANQAHNDTDVLDAILKNPSNINDRFNNYATWLADQGIQTKDLYDYWNELSPEQKATIAGSSDQLGNIARAYKAAGGMARTPVTPGTRDNPAAARKAAEDKAAQDAAISNEVMAFYNSYKKPIIDSTGKITDPTALLLAKSASGLAVQAVHGAGGEGGMSGAAAQQASMGAAVQYQQQREQMAGQALGLLNQRDLGLRGIQANLESMKAQAGMQDAANQWNQGKGVASAIGGGLGALAGGVATYFSGGAAAPLIPGLISGGAAAGGGLYGALAPAPTSSGYFGQNGGASGSGSGFGNYRPGGG